MSIMVNRSFKSHDLKIRFDRYLNFNPTFFNSFKLRGLNKVTFVIDKSSPFQLNSGNNYRVRCKIVNVRSHFHQYPFIIIFKNNRVTFSVSAMV